MCVCVCVYGTCYMPGTVPGGGGIGVKTDQVSAFLQEKLEQIYIYIQDNLAHMSHEPYKAGWCDRAPTERQFLISG